MKTSYHNWILAVIFSVLASQVLAAQETSKNIHKNYKVSATTKISINNKFGMVHINTWNKNEVDLVVKITANARNEEKTNEVLNAINIGITDSNPTDFLAYETKVDNVKGNVSFSIDYTVSMPTTCPLELENSFGDVYLQNLSGNLNLTVKYGQLVSENLTGEVELHLAFGKGESEIGFLANGDLDIRYSKLNIQGAGKIKLDSQFSNVELGKTGALQLEGKYGDFKIAEIDRFDGNLEFSGLKVGKLNNALILDSKHGNGLDIDEIGQQFSMIDLTNDFSSVTLNLPKNVNTTLELGLKFGELRTSGGNFNFTTVKKDNTSSEYKGYIGSSNASAKIIVDAKYGNVALKVAD